MPRFLGGAASSLVGGWKADGKLIAWMVPILIVIGAVLRMRFLFEPMAFDEADTFISFASKPIYLGLSLYSTPNNHIFHTLLMHIAWRLFGDQEWAIRLPVLLAGILLIPVTYCAGRVLYGKHSALIAAALVTAASPLVSYSVNARGYILVCVFFLLLLIAGRYFSTTTVRLVGCCGRSSPPWAFSPYPPCCTPRGQWRFIWSCHRYAWRLKCAIGSRPISAWPSR